MSPQRARWTREHFLGRRSNSDKALARGTGLNCSTLAAPSTRAGQTGAPGGESRSAASRSRGPVRLGLRVHRAPLRDADVSRTPFGRSPGSVPRRTTACEFVPGHRSGRPAATSIVSPLEVSQVERARDRTDRARGATVAARRRDVGRAASGASRPTVMSPLALSISMRRAAPAHRDLAAVVLALESARRGIDRDVAAHGGDVEANPRDSRTRDVAAGGRAVRAPAHPFHCESPLTVRIRAAPESTIRTSPLVRGRAPRSRRSPDTRRSSTRAPGARGCRRRRDRRSWT